MLELTPITIAQFAVRQIIAMNVADAATIAVDRYTEIDPDSKTVKIGAAVAGQVVAYKLKPITDPMVVKTANKISGWKANRRNKKTPVNPEVEIVDAEVVS
jgi:hypothetical protein